VRFSLANNLSEFKNENIEVQVSKQPGCQVKLNIFVTPKGTNHAYSLAMKAVNKEVSLPGFRKGKAPEKLLLQNFKKPIEQEWNEILVRTFLNEAFHLTQIYPFNNNSVKRPLINKISLDEGAQISVEMEISPEIPHVDLSLLSVTQKTLHEVTDADVEDTIKNIRMHHAHWEKHDDQSVKDGDFVDLDIVALDGDQNEICKDTRFEVLEGKMGNWMRKLILGLKVNESAEGISEKETDSHEHCDSCLEGEEHQHHEDTSFKPTKCKITVKSILNPLLPALDEELAKKTGTKSIEELRERIKESLKQKAEETVKEDLRKQIDLQLLEKYPFDIPHSILQAEKKQRMLAIKNDFQQQNKLNEFDAAKDNIESQVASDIEKVFRLFFLSRKIAEENNIDVTQDEIIKEMMTQMYSGNAKLQGIDPNTPAEEIRSRLFVTILSRKTKDFLIEKAQRK
jgi:trigger factor